MNKDTHQIFETYIQKPANMQIVQEGMFDRLKARGAQAIGTVKGLGQQAAGTVKGAVAGVKGDVAGVEAAQQQRKAGAAQGAISKVESYKKTANQKIDKTVNDIFNDLKKLGIDLQKISPKSANALKMNMNKAFNDVIASLK